jgi:hypothetical protein
LINPLLVGLAFAFPIVALLLAIAVLSQYAVAFERSVGFAHAGPPLWAYVCCAPSTCPSGANWGSKGQAFTGKIRRAPSIVSQPLSIKNFAVSKVISPTEHSGWFLKFASCSVSILFSDGEIFAIENPAIAAAEAEQWRGVVCVSMSDSSDYR